MNKVSNINDKKRALEILELTFLNSNGFNWISNQKFNKRGIKYIIRIIYTVASLRGGAYLSNDKNGVMLFYRMQKHKFSISQIFNYLYLLFSIGITNTLNVLKYKFIIESLRPKEGLVGLLLATNQRRNLKCLYYDYKKISFQIADKINQPIFIETTSKKARKLYLLSGFYQYLEIKHPFSDLTVWFLRRDPCPMNHELNAVP